MPASKQLKGRVSEILRILKRTYPEPRCALEFSNPLELLIATILSAQCTDVRVNLVTKDLFRKYRSAADYAQAPQAELEQAIQSTGFYRNKAKNLRACCQLLVERHGGEVPRDLDALVQLPGVGRKTANVVLGTALDIPSGVVVDTHVSRLSRRLGLSAEKHPERIEADLMELIPKREWINFSHRLIHHGRRICVARKPNCPQCPLLDVCPKVGVAS